MDWTSSLIDIGLLIVRGSSVLMFKDYFVFGVVAVIYEVIFIVM